MTIEEAIKHIDEVVSNGAMREECNKEHLQLKQWLLENIELKKEIEELINENTELKVQLAMFQKKEREQVTKILIDEYTYTGKNSDEEVSDTILIRENDGEWREPLVEE